MEHIRWSNDSLFILDQTKLPREEVFVKATTYKELIVYIKRLVIRGAPLIGIAGAYGVVLAYLEALRKNESSRKEFFEQALNELTSARPTAVNLPWAIERLKRVWQKCGAIFSNEVLSRLIFEADSIFEEDLNNNKRMAEFGCTLINESSAVITHCNAGALATGGIGTALGVIFEAYKLGKINHVFACETRPLLQGLRLTSWELNNNGIPHTVICDNMAATVMNREKIGAVIVGADRIALNGDVANKVGTYSLAISAKFHGIPFYVVAPISTFDFSLPSGHSIPIEERPSQEILQILGENQPNYPVNVLNSAFDVTPSELIDAIICEKGIIKNPCEKVFRKIFFT